MISVILISLMHAYSSTLGQCHLNMQWIRLSTFTEKLGADKWIQPHIETCGQQETKGLTLLFQIGSCNCVKLCLRVTLIEAVKKNMDGLLCYNVDRLEATRNTVGIPFAHLANSNGRPNHSLAEISGN